MSKIAILSDIHSNLPAFEAVLRDVQTSGAERIVFLGDIVGYGASPAECVAQVRKLGGSCVMGNHDAEIRRVRQSGCAFRDPDWRKCGYQAGLAHSAKCLDADQAAWLAALPFSMKIPGAIVAHASLDEPEGFAYIQDAASAEATLEILREEKTKVGFFGHTHVQEVFPDPAGDVEWLDGSRFRIPLGMACVVMVGAVGQPRHATDRRAAWVLWNPETSVVEFRKTNYSRLEAAQAIAKSGLPLESALRLLTEDEAAFLMS
jgi:predicted phosphodiesterase